MSSLPADLHFMDSAAASISSPSRRVEPFIIGVAGGTASGKTTVCAKIHENLSQSKVVVISQDSFYKGLSSEQRENVHDYNFDHPDAFDYELLGETIRNLKQGRRVEIPVYCFKTHSRTGETKSIFGADVIILEGILIFYSKELVDLMDMRIFVDTDSDTRLARRIARDISERGRDLSSVLQQYEKTVKPSFDDYIFPTKKHADIIVPRGGDNIVAIDLIVEHIRSKQKEISESRRAALSL